MTLASLILLMLLTQQETRPSQVDGPTLPRNVRSALESNGKAFNGLLISGEKHQRMLTNVEQVREAFGLKIIPVANLLEKVRFELRFLNGKYRETLWYPADKYHSGEGVNETAFDGTKFYYGTHDPKKEDSTGLLVITTPTINDREAILRKTISSWINNNIHMWYPEGSGFHSSTKSNDMGRSVESVILKRGSAGRIISVGPVSSGNEIFLEVIVEYPEPWQSRNTTPVQTDPSIKNLLDGTDKFQTRIEQDRRKLVGQLRRTRLWLDESLGYAVREAWEYRGDLESPMFHTVNTDFEKIGAERVWLPKHCEIYSHSHPMSPLTITPNPLYSTVIELDRLERTSFSEDDFRLWYDTPGHLVKDYTNPKYTIAQPLTYQVPSSMKALMASSRGIYSLRPWFVLVSLGVTTIVIIILYKNSKKSPLPR